MLFLSFHWMGIVRVVSTSDCVFAYISKQTNLLLKYIIIGIHSHYWFFHCLQCKVCSLFSTVVLVMIFCVVIKTSWSASRLCLFKLSSFKSNFTLFARTRASQIVRIIMKYEWLSLPFDQSNLLGGKKKNVITLIIK